MNRLYDYNGKIEQKESGELVFKSEELLNSTDILGKVIKVVLKVTVYKVNKTKFSIKVVSYVWNNNNSIS